MSFSLEQCEKDGWKCEALGACGLWFECIYNGTWRNGKPRVQNIEDACEWQPQDIRNLPPKPKLPGMVATTFAFDVTGNPVTFRSVYAADDKDCVSQHQTKLSAPVYHKKCGGDVCLDCEWEGRVAAWKGWSLACSRIEGWFIFKPHRQYENTSITDPLRKDLALKVMAARAEEAGFTNA